jgi:hypothetical protein
MVCGIAGEGIAPPDWFGQCIACPEKRKSDRTKFCLRHDSIQRTMNRTCASKLTGEAKSAALAAHKESMSDDLSAAMKVRDWETKNMGQKPGKPSVPYDHVAFMHRFKSVSYTDKFVRAKMMDIIEYAKRQNKLRDWSYGRCEEEWDKMKKDPRIVQDENGTELIFIPVQYTYPFCKF